MKRLLRTCALIALLPLTAQAQSMDIIGGPDSNTQTIHHCGFLNSSAKLYTSSPITIAIIERKLTRLGYNATTDGNYGKRDKAAVRAFQADAGIQVDGIVGPITAKHLAFASHPSANVRRCYRPVASLR
jgi:murein L,D-transpeptidase YcbB/YkuD